MDITPGEFESFRSYSSRSRSSDTRSSMRSDTTGSLEILPPEEDKDVLFMSEELSDEDDSPVNQKMYNDTSDSEKNLPPRSSSTSTSSSSPLHGIFDKDPELKRLIRKMKKYDKMLQLSTKKEKEVKLQRLLFQKRMMDELNAYEGKSEDKLANNESKFLALMPPPDRLQEMMLELQKEEQPTPIFQTEMTTDESTVPSVCSGPRREDKPESASSQESTNNKSDPVKTRLKKKIDFIKRNIELAKDAGNHISMTDDEKARLNELLSDLDEVTDSEYLDVKEAFGRLSLVGQGYTPNEEDGKRLAEIDEKIQSLIPEEEFSMICGTPHLSARATNMHFDTYNRRTDFNSTKSHPNVKIEEVQKRLEDLDDEWRQTFEGTTPRLTDEQLQKLLDECSLPRSSVNSSLSLRTLTESQTSFHDYHHSSMSDTHSHTDMPSDEICSDNEEWGELNLSIMTKLPSDTLEQLLSEARTSLGLPPSSSKDTQSEKDTNHCQSPIFERVENRSTLSQETDIKSPISEELSLEEV